MSKYKADQKFYLEIWSERTHECKECWKNLGETMSRYFMAHILSKGSYPSFRHDKRNIVLLCIDHHNQLDGKFEGKTKDNMIIGKYLEEVRVMLKNEYHANN